jgi:hypothetical protein
MDTRGDCKNYLFPPTGGKKLRTVANKITETNFLLESHRWIGKKKPSRIAGFDLRS